MFDLQASFHNNDLFSLAWLWSAKTKAWALSFPDVCSTKKKEKSKINSPARKTVYVRTYRPACVYISQRRDLQWSLYKHSHLQTCSNDLDSLPKSIFHSQISVQGLDIGVSWRICACVRTPFGWGGVGWEGGADADEDSVRSSWLHPTMPQT